MGVIRLKRVAIVVGHSEKAQGARSVKGLTEYGYNKVFAAELAKSLQRHGVEGIVVYRHSSMAQLVEDINSTNASLCIELHCNGFSNPRVSGSETLYWHQSKGSMLVAEAMQKATVEALRLNNRGIKPITKGGRGAYVLRGTKMRCVITEPAFLTCAKDTDVLIKYQSNLIEAWTNTIAQLI